MAKSTEKVVHVTRVGLDLAKNIFQVHGVDASGQTVIVRKLRRSGVLEFFGRLPPCVVAMEACASAHHWGREIAALGHEVKLIPPAHVKPLSRAKVRTECGAKNLKPEDSNQTFIVPNAGGPRSASARSCVGAFEGVRLFSVSRHRDPPKALLFLWNFGAIRHREGVIAGSRLGVKPGADFTRRIDPL